MISVLVVTDRERQGVFFGYLTKEDYNRYSTAIPDTLTITKARMVVQWSAECKGIIGLASIGPISEARITPAASELIVNGVIAIIKCSKEATKIFESEPWA